MIKADRQEAEKSFETWAEELSDLGGLPTIGLDQKMNPNNQSHKKTRTPETTEAGSEIIVHDSRR